MKKVIWATLLVICIGAAVTGEAQDLVPSKIIDVQSFSASGAPVIAPNNGHPVIIPISRDMFSLTLGIGDMSYEAQYPESRHLKAADLIVGDTLPARIEGKRMFVKMPNGKIMKAKVLRRERLSK